MNLEKISKDIYNVDAWMDEQYGKVGSPEREEFRKEAYVYCVGQIIHDARKQEKNDTNRTCSKNRNELYIQDRKWNDRTGSWGVPTNP